MRGGILNQPVDRAGNQVAACLGREAQTRGLVLDATQHAAIVELQRLHDALLQPYPLQRWLHAFHKPQQVSGLYLWGGVGRGKSFVMDAFFACVPIKHKRRLHFHQFMQEMHAGLTAHQGQPDSIARLTQAFSRQVRLLCLDELQVNDIADAMLLRGLFQGLLNHNVVIVTTSNAEPDALYRNGLQRSQFQPCIDLIKSRMEVRYLDGGKDYRRTTREQAGLYHTPLNAAAERALEAAFLSHAGNQGEQNTQLQIAGRMISARYQATNVAWFEFNELCAGPRSKADYIELAARFRTILFSGVPQFHAGSITEARRFLWLVDELYDRRIKLIISAAVPLTQLAVISLFDGEFERTLSRLIEMQSHAYLAQVHQMHTQDRVN